MEHACKQSRQIHQDIEELLDEYRELISSYRSERHMRALRSDSAAFTILTNLPSAPVLTAKSASKIFGLSPAATTNRLNDLADSGVLTVADSPGATSIYSARALLALLTVTERRLASTPF